MTTHSGILAQRIPWTVEPDRLQTTGLQRVDITEVTQYVCTHATSHTHLFSHLSNKYLMSPNQLCVLCACKQDKIQRSPLSNSSPVEIFILHCTTGASPVAQLVKNLPAMWETQVQSLDQEDPLEKDMATYSSILAWRIPWTLQSMGSQRVRHN